MTQFDTILEITQKMSGKFLVGIKKIEFNKKITQIISHPKVQEIIEKKSVRITLFIA
jgi:hypothetical protein